LAVDMLGALDEGVASRVHLAANIDRRRMA
jgi:hypothetical protein